MRFGKREQAIFAQQLAMLLRSGLHLSEGISLMGAQARTRTSSYILSRMAREFARGRTLAACMADFRNMFGVFAIAVVDIGERSGTLAQSLAYLSEELKKQNALRKKVIGALVYPAVVICATVGISLMLTVEIFPKILPVFRGFKQQLPLSTRMLIFLSTLLIRHGVLLGIALACAGCGFFFAARLNAVQDRLHRLILIVPIFGKLARSYAISSGARTTGLLLRSGIPIVQALTISGDAAANSAYRDAIGNIARMVGSGARLSEEMNACARLFPPPAPQVIHAGEQSGDLAGALFHVSELYEEEVEELTKNLTTLLEPLLMLGMGAVVGFIAISIIEPIYGITQNLSI